MTGLAPPDIEGGGVVLLNGTAIHVGTKLPPTLPATAIRISRVGGGGRNLIQTDPRLLVECWAVGSTAAFNLARVAYGRMWAAANSFWTPGVFVTRVSLEDPVNFPDSQAPKHDRYQFLATVTTSLTEVSA